MMKKLLKSKFKKLKLRTYIALGLLILLLPVILLSLFHSQTADAAWFNDSWAFRKLIPITAHTAAETNKYFSVTVDTSDTTKFQADCGDIRFTDNTGSLLQYYISSGCSSASTVLHVNVPSFPAGATDYYMYYGNPTAVNGFSSADFTAGTGVTVGSVGSEEKGVVAIANWTFDEGSGTTARDMSKNSTTGTLTNMASPATGISGWQTEDLCVTGKCVAFDGTNDYVTVADASSLDVTTNFSLSAWVNARATSGTDLAIINKGRDATATYAYELALENGLFVFKLYDGSSNPQISGSTTVAVQTWYYITATYDGSTLKIYVNGKLENSTSSSINIGNQSGPLVMGKNANASDRYFSGKIDDARVYNYALSATQVKNNYNNHGTDDGNSVSLGTNNPAYLSDGLMGYWKMDESAANSCTGGSNDSCDSSGLGGDGAWTGTITSTAGKFGNALSFGGGYMDVSGSPTITGTGVTFSAWIYPTTTTSRDEIVDFAGFKLFNLQNAKLCFYDGDVNSSYFCSTASITTNTWTHVVGSYDTKTKTEKLYINGVLDSSFVPTGAPSSGTLTTSIGYCSACSGNYFTGKLDEIRVYRKALSDAETKALYNWAPGPVGYWNFDDKTGTTVTDRSGGGLNATITDAGTAVGSWTAGKYGSAYNLKGGDGADVDKINFGGSSVSLGTINTVSFWVNFNNIGSNGASVATSDQITCGTNCGYMAYFDNAGTIYSRPETGSAVSVSTGTLTMGRWYHFAVVRNGTSITFYMNGVRVGATQTLGANNAFSLFSLTNFRTAGANDFPVDGILDEIKVYNYDRTPQQIIEDMNGGHATGGSPVGSYVSYWRMDEANSTTAHDYNALSGNSLTLSTSSWDLTGKTNSAWKGVGTNWLSRADDDDFDLAAADSGSISMWFKSTSATNPGATEYLFAKGRGSPPGYAVYFNTSGFLCFSIDDDVTWTPDDTACTTTDLYDGTWHHVVAEKNATTELRLYVDGLSRAADTSIAATGTLANSGTLYVGDDDGDSTNSFNGDIDEVKFYRSVLTVDQVAIDYNAGANINFGSTASVESSQLTDGTGNPPVGYWKLDEKTGTTAADSSGNGNTGTLDSDVTWTKGKIGSGVNTTAVASGNAVRINASSTINNLGPLTFSAWVYAKSAGGSNIGRIVLKGDNSTTGWFIRSSSTNTIHFQVKYSTTDLSVDTASNTFLFNQWNYVTVTWDGTTSASGVKIYINGVLNANSSATNGSGTYGADTADIMRLGNSNSTHYWDGYIDDAKLYNYVRTAAQVAYDYNRGRPVGWWRFDECQGSTTNDSSGNGNSGTITIGATGTQTSAGTCNTSSTAWGNGINGKFNNSLNFDGTDDYVACTDASCGGTTKLDFGASVPFSFGAWINTSSAASKIIMSKKDGTTSGSAGYLLQLSASNFAVCRISDGTTQVSPTDTIALNDSAWHFVMCVHTGSALNLYVDGKLRVSSSTASVTGTLDNASDFRVGTTGTPASNYFSGQIDDVRIYNYALSLTQIQKIYNGSAVYFGPSSGQP